MNLPNIPENTSLCFTDTPWTGGEFKLLDQEERGFIRARVKVPGGLREGTAIKVVVGNNPECRDPYGAVSTAVDCSYPIESNANLKFELVNIDSIMVFDCTGECMRTLGAVRCYCVQR